MASLFSPLSNEGRRVLNRLPRLIDKVFPMPGRFRSGLPRDVAELSGLLTANREDRGASYLGKPALLSAYLRYFMPWNIYRLCRLLPGLPLDLKSHDTVNDVGAGPLTLAAALWISRPDLRRLPLEFRCVDRTPAVLEAGRKFFAALASDTIESDGGRPGGSDCPWVIKTIRGELKRHGGLSIEIKGKPAALTAAVNVYNELFWNFSPLDTEGLAAFTNRAARLLSSLTNPSGSILVMEPGIPRCGEFISLLRLGFMKEGRCPLSPCVHSGLCPLSAVSGPGSAPFRKAKWCHFAFDTEDAPDALHKLSGAAGIPKERAVLSFILAGPASRREPLGRANTAQHDRPQAFVKARVVSDLFPAGEGWGRYGCSERGLVLVSGTRKSLEGSPSGALEELRLQDGRKDGKSGALMAEKTSG
ncbi:MAG: rRNA methyltransferase [Treponema sp.]|nr:rRNA methyltransferase [Treponema sp.]